MPAAVQVPRRKDLIRMITKQAADARNGTILDSEGKAMQHPNWPTCLTCGLQPYKVEMMDCDDNCWVEVRVECLHQDPDLAPDNAPVFEDWAKIYVPYGVKREEHIGMCLRYGTWFDPKRPPK